MLTAIELACHALPLIGQQALSETNDDLVLGALAASPLTDVSIVNNIFNKTPAWGDVKALACERITDPSQLEKILTQCAGTNWTWGDSNWGDSGGADYRYDAAVYAARNPLTPTETLVKALHPSGNHIALSAYLNPATPEEERRKLTPKQANALCIGDPGEKATCAQELVLANPWMLETPAIWGNDIRLGMLWSPDATPETLEAMNTRATTLDVEALIHKMEIVANTSATVEELLATEWIGGCVKALNHLEFTHQHALTILNDAPNITASVVGRIINRFGLYKIRKSRVDYGGNCDMIGSGEYWSGALIWAAPISRYAWLCNRGPDEATEACTILGTSEHNWNMFMELRPHWHGGLLEAAKAAIKL